MSVCFWARYTLGSMLDVIAWALDLEGPTLGEF